MAETDEQAFDESITLNIVHHFPEGVNLTFSDNIAVQHTPTEFIITFSQVQQPIVGRLSDYEDIDKVKAEVVARIVPNSGQNGRIYQVITRKLGDLPTKNEGFNGG